MSSKKVVILHTQAEAELQDSVNFYRENGGEELTTKFKSEVAEGFEIIALYPYQHAPMPEIDGVRKFRLRNFPFSILYVPLQRKIWVIAIAHGSRHPGFWMERLT
jgi:toxin ParE1/3/4